MANESLKDKNLTVDEINKLKSVISACTVSLQHIDDIKEQMKEMITEIAADLEINKAEIGAAAAALHKQNVAEKRAKQDALEEMLEALGYEINSTDE